MCSRCSRHWQQGDEFALHQIRVELSSENDLFFHFKHSLDEASFAVLQVRWLLQCVTVVVPRQYY
jgi:hypothetical protein